MICRGCGDHCKEDLTGVMIQCTRCEKAGCDYCNNQGRVEITECPKKYTKDIALSCNAASLSKAANMMPVAGGLLDQSAWFLDLMSAFESDKTMMQNEKFNG